jgi:hypothetical protein
LIPGLEWAAVPAALVAGLIVRVLTGMIVTYLDLPPIHSHARHVHRYPRSRIPGGRRDHGEQQQNWLRLDWKWISRPGSMARHYRSFDYCRERVRRKPRTWGVVALARLLGAC